MSSQSQPPLHNGRPRAIPSQTSCRDIRVCTIPNIKIPCADLYINIVMNRTSSNYLTGYWCSVQLQRRGPWSIRRAVPTFEMNTFDFFITPTVSTCQTQLLFAAPPHIYATPDVKPIFQGTKEWHQMEEERRRNKMKRCKKKGWLRRQTLFATYPRLIGKV